MPAEHSPAAASSSQEPTFEQEEQAHQLLDFLSAEALALRTQYRDASPLQLREVIERWFQQRAPEFASLRQIVDAIAASSQRGVALSPVAAMPIPLGASWTLAQFISEENELFQAIASLRRSAVDLSAEGRRDLLQTWHDSHAEWLKHHQLVADTLSPEISAGSEDLDLSLPIAVGATNVERDFWIEEARIQEYLLNLRADYAGSTPEARRDAIQEWFEANEERLNAHEQSRRELFGQ